MDLAFRIVVNLISLSKHLHNKKWRANDPEQQATRMTEENGRATKANCRSEKASPCIKYGASEKNVIKTVWSTQKDKEARKAAKWEAKKAMKKQDELIKLSLN